MTQEQWGTIPGPHDPVFHGTMGISLNQSDLEDSQQTDGMLATNAVLRLANFSREGIGKPGANRPFFHAVGFHKPHLPHIVPKKYYDLYNPANISLAPNPRVPRGFREENWHADGTFELREYTNAGPVFVRDNQSFGTPVDEEYARKLRHGYFVRNGMSVTFVLRMVWCVTACASALTGKRAELLVVQDVL